MSQKYNLLLRLMPEEKDDDTGPADDNRGYVMQYDARVMNR